MWFLLGVLFLICGVFYLVREVRFISKQKDMIIISYMRLLYSFTFGIIPALLCFMYSLAGIELKLKNLVAVDYSNDGLFYLFLFWFFSVVGYFFLNVGYFIDVRIRKPSNRKHYELTQLQTSIIGFIVLALGFLSLYLWTKTEGSIYNFILKANWYRADYTNSLNNAYAMFRQPAKLVNVAALIFFFQLINYKEKHKFIYLIGYSLSLIASILYLLCTDGRLQIAMFFGVQLLGFVLYRRRDARLTKHQIALIALLALSALVLIAYLDEITSFIRYGKVLESAKSGNSVFLTLMNEFGYVYESGQMSIGSSLFRGGRLYVIDDIVRGAFSILPSRFTPAGFELVWRYNTYLCTGSRSAGTIPCDIISESIYDLNVLGIIVLPWFWGQLARKVENSYQNRKENAFNRAMYMGMVLLFFRSINYCGLYDFMRGFFAYLVTYIIAYFLARFAPRVKGR